MPKKKTDAEFVNELKEKAPNILPLEQYTNSKTKIKCECKICGFQWRVTPAHLLSGRGCPSCSKQVSADKRRYSQEEFANKVHSIHPNIEVVGEYINSQTKVKVHCTKCNNTWTVVPASLLYGTGCPKCSRRYRRNTAEFIDELKQISPHITVIGEYINAHTKIRVRCERCGNEWDGDAISLLKGSECPNCLHSQTSIVEQILYLSLCFLLGNSNVYNRDKSLIDKELDIFIPGLQLAIEFGAWYWHSNRLDRDIEKEQLCEQKGIKLITIYESCPDNTDTGKLKNVICYKENISAEKNYLTIKAFLIDMCKTYNLNESLLHEQWDRIITKAKEESRKKDAEYFSSELSQVNPTIKYIKSYSGIKDPVYVECLTCGTQWHASSAYDLLHGHGCPECAKIKRSVSQRMDAKEFKERVNTVNPDIELLENFISLKTPILCRCKVCGTQWKAKPDSILYKTRKCPACSKVTKKTNEQFLEELSALNKNIIPLENYKNGRTKILFKCKKCKHEWSASPHDILQGTGCPKCAHRIPITTEEFVKRVQTVNKDIEILGTYHNSKTKIQCRCKKCGYEWSGLPSNLLKGAGCRKCSRRKNNQ